MRRLLATLPALALLAACDASSPVAPAPTARLGVSVPDGGSTGPSGNSPVSFVFVAYTTDNPCLSEPVSISGTQHNVVRTEGRGVVVQANFQGVSATGTVTGTRYPMVQNYTFTTTDFNDPFAPYTTTSMYRIVGPGPLGDVVIRSVAKVGVNAQGELTAVQSNWDLSCGGNSR